MRIVNIIPDFMAIYEAKAHFRIKDLEEYFDAFPQIFEQYFPNHCPRTKERLQQAIEKYPEKLTDIHGISRKLPQIIAEIELKYNTKFQLNLNLLYNMLVGGFGSNAFVAGDNYDEIYFSAEKLSAKTAHLQVIAAHEIAHVAHFSLATNQGMDWGHMDWLNGVTTLYKEGVATYCSKKIVPNKNEGIYFTYDDEGDVLVDFYRENKEAIKSRFLKDLESGWNMKKEKEWFRLRGGSYFGQERLGYLLGLDFVEQLVQKIGEEDALNYWVKNDLKPAISAWLT